MHKRKGSFRSIAIKKYKENLKQINTKNPGSIWEIINDPNMHFFQKVDYIRHHYVYYDGNYELFCDESGKPTQTRKLLNQVIEGIVNKRIDPVELDAINKAILVAHKERMQEAAANKEIELDAYINELKIEEDNTTEINKIAVDSPVYIQPKENTNKVYYTKIIDLYLNSLTEDERLQRSTWSYSDLKSVAKIWAKDNQIIIKQSKETTSKAMKALLKGYSKYVEKEWKNNSEKE